MISPAVRMVDEVEKAFAGVASSGQTDSGVTARMFGQFLSLMNDRTSDVFIVATCNDITKLPPESSRAFADLGRRPMSRRGLWRNLPIRGEGSASSPSKCQSIKKLNDVR